MPALISKGAANRESTTLAWMTELGFGRPPVSNHAADAACTRPALPRANTDSTLLGGAQEALQFSLTAPSDSGSAVQQGFDSRPSSTNSGNHLHPLFVPSSASFLTPASAGSSVPGSSEHSPSIDALTRSFPIPGGSHSTLDPSSTASGLRAGYTGPEGSPNVYQFPPAKPLPSNNPFRASVDAASSRSATRRHSAYAGSPTGSNPFELDFTFSEPNLAFDFTGGTTSQPLPAIDAGRASTAADSAAANLRKERMMSGFSYYNPTTPITPLPPRRGSNVSSIYSTSATDHQAEPVVSKHDSQLDVDPQPWAPLAGRQRAETGESVITARTISWADGQPRGNTARLSDIYDAYSGRAI